MLSAGLINGHDHTDFASKGPIPHGTTRYEHRHGWRKGANGEPKLSGPPLSMSPAVIAGAEVRFAMSGVTSETRMRATAKAAAKPAAMAAGECLKLAMQ